MTEFTYQVDRINDNLYFIGEVDIESVNELTQELHKLEKDKSNSTDKTVNLYITSDGGDLRQGLKLYDILQSSSLELTIYASGWVGSAATYSLFTKHKTVMYKNSYLLFHELTNSHFLNYSNVKAAITLCDIEMDAIVRIYNTKNNAITKEWLVVDKYLTADEALEMKIVDEVI